MITEDSRLLNIMSIAGDFHRNSPETELRFADGHTVRLPTALLIQGEAIAGPGATSPSTEETVVIPLVEEQLEVGKRIVETGKVRLRKSTDAYDVKLDEALAVSTWKVERVPKHEVVVEAPPSRQEGDTTIYPVVEERLILTKELVLVEEIRLTRELSERRNTQTVTLRRETLSVEREAALKA